MMTNAQLATASLDDIVFDGRNRHYGAYELRALYQRHMSRALAIATAVCALLVVFPLVAQLLKDKTVAVVPDITPANPFRYEPEAVVPPTPPAAATPPPASPQPQPTLKDVVPIVAKDDLVSPTDDVPDREKLLHTQSGVRTVKGDSSAVASLPNDLPVGKSPGVVPEVVKPYTFVEQMPELPTGGGQLAIVVAIQKAVRYPARALSNQVEGRVYVSFTVDSKGEVTDVKIVKGLGSGIDEETVRAIKTLPRFIPGKQNGREVSVSFTVPVTYKIQ